jgi:hypothetical protein
MSQVYRYKKGMLQVDTQSENVPYVFLPHSCSQWRLGNIDSVRALISDLNDYLDGTYVSANEEYWGDAYDD